MSHVVAPLLALFLGGYGYKKRSLDLSGAIGAVMVGYITCLAGWFETVVLLFFFFTSSKLTKFKADIKKKREDEHVEGEGQRNWEQVLANGGFPTLVILLLGLLINQRPAISEVFGICLSDTCRITKFLMATFLGTYISNCSDTWASEVGILSKREPWFILAPWRTVPYGTNGGVSMKGLTASFLSGLAYGVITLAWIFVEIYNQYSNDLEFVINHVASYIFPILTITIFAAMVGTTIDSILGAVFEYSCFSKRKGVLLKRYDAKEDFGDNLVHISGLNILNGNHTNFLSGVITGLLTGLLSLNF